LSRVIKSASVTMGPPQAPAARKSGHGADDSRTQSMCRADGSAERDAAAAMARRLIEDAQKRAERILKEAEAEAEDIQRRAFLEGKREGVEAGYREGLERAASLRRTAEKELEEAREKARRMILEAEPEIARLAVAVARRIVRREVSTDHEVVVSVVREALARVGGEETVAVRVNPAEVAVVHEARPALERQFGDIGSLAVEEDSSISPGGCVVTTPRGSVDARVESQLRKVEEALLEASGARGDGARVASHATLEAGTDVGGDPEVPYGP